MIPRRWPHPVPCAIWYPRESDPDAYGNRTAAYADEPDWRGLCCYAPGRRTNQADTADDIEDGRPHGDTALLTVYLPKSFSHQLRGALVAVYPDDDQVVSGRRFAVVGSPYSYPRADTPGDYSWEVEAVEHLG